MKRSVEEKENELIFKNPFWLVLFLSVSFAFIAPRSFAQDETGKIYPIEAEPRVKVPHDVGTDGTYRYFIPIKLPEFRGLQPDISITYSSSIKRRGSPGALIGVGWELTGLSSIERVSSGMGSPGYKTLAVDGTGWLSIPSDSQRSLEYFDVLSLDGEVLLACRDAAATSKWNLGDWVYPAAFQTSQPSASCSAGGNMATQLESFRKIRRFGKDDGTASFEVTEADGRTLSYTWSDPPLPQYGSPAVDPRFSRRTWLLTKVSDAQEQQNIVFISYDFSSYETGLVPRVKRISYGGYTVDFYYEELTTPLAIFSTPNSYSIGAQHSRLKTIAIRDSGMPIRAYALNYASSVKTKASLLKTVQEYGSDFILSGSKVVAGGTTIPAYTFSYSGDNYSLTRQVFSSQYKLSAQSMVWDFDDDQRMDIVVASQYAGVYQYGSVYRPSISVPEAHLGFGTARAIKSLPTDFIADTFGFGDRLNRALLSLSSQPGPSGWKLALRRNPTTRISLNSMWYEYSAYLDTIGSNGKVSSVYQIGTELLRGGDAPTWLMLPTDRNPRPEIAFGKEISSDDFDYPVLTKLFTANGFGAPTLVTGLSDLNAAAADIDGDGAVEFVEALENYPASVLKIAKRYDGVYQTIDTTLEMGQCTDLTITDDRAFQVEYGDVNADGQDDLLIYQMHSNTGTQSGDRLCVGLSNGERFLPLKVFASFPDYFSRRQENNLYLTAIPSLLVSDMNDDGLGDLLVQFIDRYHGSLAHPRLYAGHAKVYLSNGAAFEAYSGNTARDVQEFVAIGDFDGDGRNDFASMRGGSGGDDATEPYLAELPRGMRIYWGPAESPNLLKVVQTPEGGRLDVTYAPSSNYAGNYLPAVSMVVSSITASDGRGGDSITNFSYVGGRYDFERRRALGFKTVTAILQPVAGETQGPQVVTTYLNDHVAEYGTVKSRIVVQGGVTLSREIFDYSILKTGNGPWRADRISERKATLFGAALVETMQTREVNAFGQITRETAFGFTTNGTNFDTSDDVTATTGYVPNLAAYIVDRPSFIRDESGAGPTAGLADDLSYAAFTYDGASGAPTYGNLTKVEQWNGNPAALTLRTAKVLSYDAWGNVLTETDAKAAASGDGPTATHTYETVKHLFRLTTSNALGQTESVAWNALCQTPATITDPNLRTTTKTYDPFCRETRTDLPGAQYLITRYVSFGSPTLQHIEREQKSGSLVAGRTLSIAREYFDGFGRTWLTAQPGTTSALADAIITLTAYDARGNLAWSSLPLPWSAAATTPSPSQRITFTYDGLNRTLTSVAADGAQTAAEYLTQSFSHFGGITLTFPTTRQLDAHCFDDTAATTICGELFTSIDSAGRPIRMARHDTGLTDTDAGAQSLRATSYRYDLKGSLIAVTDPGGISFAYTYDIYGNRLSADDPGLGFWTLTYDANNNLLTQTDAKGQLISFAYDALNRVTLKTVGTGPTRVETRFTYDQPRAGFYNKERETTQEVWAPLGTTHLVERDWHLMGGLAVERHMIDGRTYALETSFAPNGAPLDQKLPGTPGDTTTGWIGPFTYDAAGRVTAFTGYVTGVSYNAWGQPTAAAYGNGVTEAYAYDPARGWLTSAIGTLPGGDMAFRAAFDRSETGRIFRADTQALVGGIPTDAGGSYNYAYDYTGRLLAATNWRGVTGFDQVFAYDRAGRIRAKGPTPATAMTYDYADPLTPDHAPGSVTVGGVTTDFTYDANGNMLTGLRAKIMTYDGENRPLSVTHLGKRTCYVYGVDGKRLKKVEGLAATQDCTTIPATAPATVYFGAVEVRKWKIAGQEQILTYPHPSVKLVNGVTPAVATYLHRDGLSSVRAITSAAGMKIESALYKPFGEQSEWVLPGNAAPETKGWIGERYDADSGLQYLNARYYDSELGMFVQPDWFEVTKAGVGTNRFSYSFNDPVNKLDPGGNQFNDWSKDQEVADKDNKRRADEFRKLAKRLKDPKTLDERASAFLGGASRAEKSAADFENRIGMSRSERIRHDVGDLLGTALMGIAPGRVGPRAVPPQANAASYSKMIDNYGPGQGFTGVYDASTGKIAIRPSSNASPLPEGMVPRAGGHRQVSAELGGNATDHVGFAVIIQESGGLTVTWRSGTLNSGPGALVPESLRPPIVREITNATGRTVVGN